MKIEICALFLSCAISQICVAKTQESVAFGKDNTWATVMLMDNPTESGPYEAAELYDILNVPIISSTPEYGNQVKQLTNEILTIVCGVPLVQQPSGEKFSSCRINLKAGPCVAISTAHKTAKYSINGKEANEIYNGFVNKNKSVRWLSANRKLRIESSPEILSIFITE